MFRTLKTITDPVCIALIAALSAAGCAAGSGESDEPITATSEALASCRPSIPAALAVPAGNRLAFELKGVGAQIYVCTKSSDDTTASWVFKAPDADLLTRSGHIAGSHYAGPTWEARDGSTVVGTKLAAVTVDTTAIPWLLLQAASHTGKGVMSNVTFVQRLSTTQGLAPSTGCDVDHADAIADVAYTATYAFYEASRAHKK